GLDPREIGNVLKYGFTSPFTQIYLKSGFNEETSSLLKSRVKDQTLVDLGSGEEIFSILPWLKEAGISEFVGVDKFPNKDLSWYQDKIKQNDLNGNYFKDDMLLFLAKLPDESANVMINGIDHTIISNNEYWEKLKQEIRRVIPKYGVVLGYSSDFSEIEGLKSIKMIKDDNALSILGKE
ncbi:MAG: hypothetical protein WCG45_05785, partial [bacterium]